MKKTIKSLFILLMVTLVLVSNKSFAWGMDEVSDMAEKVFKEWMNQYTLATANEEEKLKVYYLGSYSAFSSYEEFKEGKDIVVKMGVLVYPVKENSEKWSQFEKLSYENSKDGGRLSGAGLLYSNV